MLGGSMGRLRLEKRPLDTPGRKPLYFSYFAVLPLEKPWPPRRGFFVLDSLLWCVEENSAFWE